MDMSFSNADVTAYISGNSQRTEEITFKASELQTITMKLPSGVKLHNVTTGKTSSAGASVEICGGTDVYKRQVGNIPVDSAFLLVYSADGDGQILKIRTLGSPTQIFTSGKQFMADNSKRESARWEEALDVYKRQDSECLDWTTVWYALLMLSIRLLYKKK